MNKEYLRKLKVRLAVVWAVGMVICGITYLFVLKPQQNEMNKIVKEIQQKQLEHQQLLEADKPEEKVKILKHLAQVDEQLNQFVLNIEERGNVTLLLSDAASKSGVEGFSSESMSQGGREFIKIANCPTVGENYYEVSFTGNYLATSQFINQIEKNSPILYIDNLKITTSANQDEAPQVTMALTALVRTNRVDQSLRGELSELQLEAQHRKGITKTANADTSIAAVKGVKSL